MKNKRLFLSFFAVLFSFALCACDILPTAQTDDGNKPVVEPIVIKEPTVNPTNDPIVDPDIDKIDPDSGDDVDVNGNQGTADNEYACYYPYEADVKVKDKEYSVEEIVEVSKAYFEYLDKEAADYESYIEGETGYDRLKFCFVNLDGDNSLELAYAFESAHVDGVYLAAYNFDTKQVELIDVLGGYGCTEVFAGQNISISSYVGFGYSYNAFLTYDEDYSQRVLVEFEDNSGAVEYDEDIFYKINDEEVSEEEYYDLYYQWMNYYGQYYRYLSYDYMIPYERPMDFSSFVFNYNVDEEVIEEAFEGYKNVLAQLGYPAFSLVYIDSDNCPELVTAYGNGAADSVTVFGYDSYGKQPMCYGGYGLFGQMDYIPDTGIVIHTTSLGGSKFYKISGNAIVPVNSFEDTEVFFGEDGENNYKLDGMFVDKDTYYAYREAWYQIEIRGIGYDEMEQDYSEDDILDLFEDLR